MQEIWTSFATALPLPLPFPCSPFDSKSANFLGAAVQPLGDDHISPLSAALAGKKNLLPNGPPNQKQEIWRKGSEFLASHLPPWVWNLPMAGKSHLFYNSPSPSPSLPFPCLPFPFPCLPLPFPCLPFDMGPKSHTRMMTICCNLVPKIKNKMAPRKIKNPLECRQGVLHHKIHRFRTLKISMYKTIAFQGPL